MIEAFEKIVSPVLGFLDDCCELGGGDDPIWILKDDLYNGWYFETGLSHDFVIENTGAPELLRAQVARVLEALRAGWQRGG